MSGNKRNTYSSVEEEDFDFFDVSDKSDLLHGNMIDNRNLSDSASLSSSASKSDPDVIPSYDERRSLGRHYSDEEFSDENLTDVSSLGSNDDYSNSKCHAPPEKNSYRKEPRPDVFRNTGTDINRTFKREELTSRVLDPNSDQADMAKILHEMLQIEDSRNIGDGSESRSSFGPPKRATKHSGKTKKNLSLSPFQAREIDRENRRLLNRLSNPHRKPLFPGQHSVPPRKPASAGINRVKHIEKIEQENSRILRRIESAKGSAALQKNVLENEHKNFVRYALNCSKSKNIAGITDYPKPRRATSARSGNRALNALDAWDY